MPKQVWTPEKDAKLLGLYNYGLKPAYIAEQMGLTIASVDCRYRKLKKAQSDDQRETS
jgi:hypothetical protein